MASSKKTIVVVGATGQQGSSVVKTFLKLPQWHVKALTRDPSSKAAQELSAKGAETVKGDLSDADSLTEAFAGAHAIFLNTDFWTTYKPLKAQYDAQGNDPGDATDKAFAAETSNGRNAVDAAATVPTLERFIYSTLSKASKTSGGKYNRSGHNNSKAWVTEYIEAHPTIASKTSYIYVGAYAANALLYPRADPQSGKYLFYNMFSKDIRMPIIDTKESVGPFVRALVEDEAPGTNLLAYDSVLSTSEIVDAWKRATGKDAAIVDVTTKMMHEKTGLAWEMLDVIDAFNEYGYMGGVKKYIEPDGLKNKPITKPWEQYLRENNTA